MRQVSLGLYQIGERKFQIICKSDSSDKLFEYQMIKEVIKYVEIAERCKGVAIQEPVHTYPAKLIVHVTYQFSSGNDLANFLAQWDKQI